VVTDDLESKLAEMLDELGAEHYTGFPYTTDVRE